MVYGITVRYGWTTDEVFCDPTNIWKVWDSFGIAGSKMTGYWQERPLVTTSNKDILATTYLKDKKMLISVASWAKTSESFTLNIDYKLAGLDPKKVKIHAPFVDKFQPEKYFRTDEAITVEPTKGWLLIVEEN